MRPALIVGFILAAAFTLPARPIVSPAGGGARTIQDSKDYFRNVTGSWDNRGGGTFTEAIHCKFFRYGPAGQRLPLVVMFIPWGGSINGAESVVEYEDIMNDPFMTMVIMPEYNGSDDNPSNWYWGNRWTDAGGQKRSVPWTHNAVIDIINDIKHGRLDTVLLGNTIDTNRIYAMGSSIGGTAAAQIGIKHPEIFAAVHTHSGWTRYWGSDNHFFSDSRGCLAFADLIGGVSHTGYCTIDSQVMVQGNADQKYLSQLTTLFPAFRYTDLNWYFGRTDSVWNYRNPGFETPFVFVTTGSQDDPGNQGDNLLPALDDSRRGSMYYRINAGHTAGGIYVRWNWLRNFRKNRSFLAFTNRTYDDFQNFSGNGYMNDLTKHGWDPDSIIDEPTHYHVKLTGTGTADVTLRNLQKLVHTPGTTYTVTINGVAAAGVTADQYGLVTIPKVANAAAIDLKIGTTSIGKPAGRNFLQVSLAGAAGTNQIYSLSGKKIIRQDLSGSHSAKMVGVYIKVSKRNNRVVSTKAFVND